MAHSNRINRKFIDAQSMAASFNSEALLLQKAAGSQVQLAFTGSPVGALSLQTSADTTDTAASVANWDTVPDSSQNITEAGTHLWNINLRIKWIRVVFTRTSGTGSCDGTIFAVEKF